MAGLLQGGREVTRAGYSGGGIRTRDLRVMSSIGEIGWTTWGTVSSGFREIELRGDHLESVGHLAPFLAPVWQAWNKPTFAYARRSLTNSTMRIAA